ncbi:hypothetical protein [Shivajiella indica]|uniref:Right-handed parallel beta-helix repeat-containing protein n=1 Tax=Shivajiella indica TaxID=872115 RepID=A0ABW5B955_9BACT
MKRPEKTSFKRINQFLRIIGILILTFCLHALVFAQRTYTVNSIEDFEDVDLSDKKCADKNGNCTLRAAIQNANASKLKDIIQFDVKDGTTKRIVLQESLPAVIYPIEIYGTKNEEKIDPVNGIILDGNEIEIFYEKDRYSAEKRAGLYLSDQSSGSTINGLIFQSFEFRALYLDSENNTIQNNIFGSVQGNFHEGNRLGLYVFGGNNLIGGLVEGESNYFSGNLTALVIQTNDNNKIIGNEIGYYSIDNCIGKNSTGIEVHALATNTLISGNIISGNTVGLSLNGSGNSVYNNFIGTDKTGEKIVGNHTGILVGFSCNNSSIGKPELGNLISGNEVGIIIDRMRGSVATAEQIRDRLLNIEIQSNKIGTDVTGTHSLGNQYGVVVKNTGGVIIGGMKPTEANLISGNQEAGILLQDCFETLILGNKIGVNSFGKGVLTNTIGIFLDDIKKHGESENILIKGNQIKSGRVNGIYIGEGWKDVTIQANSVTGSGDTSSSHLTGAGVGFKKFHPYFCFGGEDSVLRNVILFHKYGLLTNENHLSSIYIDKLNDVQKNELDYGVIPLFFLLNESSTHQFPSYEKLHWEELISFFLVRDFFMEGELEFYQNYLARIPD